MTRTRDGVVQTRHVEYGHRMTTAARDAETVVVPLRPCWLNGTNLALRSIFTIRRVYADGVKANRRDFGGSSNWDRWAGWRAVREELASTIAHNAAFGGVDSHPDDLDLYRRVQRRIYRVTPR